MQGRVLVVDDSPLARTMVGESLRRAGYEVHLAENGAQALQLTERRDFDVVVTDLRMPELDGFGVLESLRSRPYGPEVIILTGTHAQDIGSAVRALRLGAHDFLTKPPQHPDEVVLTVDRAVEKHRLRASNLRLLRELEALSLTDALTGVLNRRAFDGALVRELARAQRYGYPLSLALLDLDHFKRVNDRYGHTVGDQVLEQFARRLSALFRDCDAVYRYGGEEFAVLLPHTGTAGAAMALRRLVAATLRERFQVAGHELLVSVSAGVAASGRTRQTPAELLTAADGALYEAKRRGRRRVCMAADAPVSRPPTPRSGVRRPR